MDTIDRTVLRTLASHREYPAVSLYLPTHRAGSQQEQDPIRLKNLIRSAHEHLVAENMREPSATALLGEATALLDDAAFWRGAGDGLAVFVSASQTLVYRVDKPMPEQSVVGSRFYLRPLALAFHDTSPFFALAFDRGRARLFSGDTEGISEIELDPQVASFAEATKYDGREESLQFTTHASPSSVATGGGTIGLFHGHAGESADKDELREFAIGLDRAVVSAIGPMNNAPLVLLGVEYELAVYRTVNTYAHLVDEQVPGATDELSAGAIRERVLDALAPVSSRAVDADLEELREKPGALVTSDAVEIVSAAASGRVKTIFFDEQAGPFGLFDRSEFKVRTLCAEKPRFLRETIDSDAHDGECGWDLVDLALAETVLHGGDLHAFSGENPPVDGVAAVLRY